MADTYKSVNGKRVLVGAEEKAAREAEIAATIAYKADPKRLGEKDDQNIAQLFDANPAMKFLLRALIDEINALREELNALRTEPVPLAPIKLGDVRTAARLKMKRARENQQ